MTIFELIFGICLLVIALAIISMILVLGHTDNTNNEHTDIIKYSQNGYHSTDTGYQTGKFTKNNTYNKGR